MVDGKTTAIRVGSTRPARSTETSTSATAKKPGVKPESRTPTFAALRLEIDTERWKGVPFYIRSGKADDAASVGDRHSLQGAAQADVRALSQRGAGAERASSCACSRTTAVSLGFEVKIPGAALALTPGIEVTPVDMSFSYSSVFGTDQYPAYETLLLDVIDRRRHALHPAPTRWRRPGSSSTRCSTSSTQDTSPLPTYPAGSWGTERESNALLQKDGFSWRRPGDPPATAPK